ncbi:MAG TPA: alpha/beta hydrolase, partial [Yinghuangia sp.]|nr:alpha/beta hydrolase [Yinghuangia sp.]
GAGDPVILVGGALCDRGIHRELADFLAPHFTVVNYDRRGRGESGDTPPYAVEREIEDIAALIGAAGGRAAVYGISSGGALALRAAAAGLPVTKVIAYDPPYVVSEDARAAQSAQGAAVPELIRQGRAEEALERFLASTGIPAEAVTAMRGTPAWAGLVAVAPTLAHDFAIMGDSRVPTEHLAAITAPTLLVDGALSPPFMRDAVRTTALAVDGARHVTLPGQGHDVSADALGPILIEFLAEP